MRRFFYYKKKDEIIEIIESCYDGYIKIWDFHSGNLLSKIQILKLWGELQGSHSQVGQLCIWEDDYIFVCCGSLIKLADLKTGKILKKLDNKNGSVRNLIQFIHPKYGKCLLSRDDSNQSIKLWTI